MPDVTGWLDNHLHPSIIIFMMSFEEKHDAFEQVYDIVVSQGRRERRRKVNKPLMHFLMIKTNNANFWRNLSGISWIRMLLGGNQALQRSIRVLLIYDKE